MGSINTARLREKAAEMPSPSSREKALTRLASSSRSCPSRREISEPPPTPAKPARQRVRLNTGSIREVPATM